MAVVVTTAKNVSFYMLLWTNPASERQRSCHGIHQPSQLVFGGNEVWHELAEQPWGDFQEGA